MSKLTRSQLIAGTASALAAAPHVVRSQTADKIRVCAAPTDGMTPLFWAAKNGMYQKAGLDVEFIPMSSGTAAATAVISGAYEIGSGSSIALLEAYLKNIPVTVIGNNTVWNSKSLWGGFLVGKDSAVKTGADLSGAVVGCLALNDIDALAASVWVDKSGGDSKTLKWVEVPGSSADAAVAAHRVVASYANEPQLSAALETGQIRMLTPPVLDAIAPLYTVAVYFARPDWAKNNVRIVERFIRTTYEAAAFTNTHSNATMSMISEITKIALPTIQKMARIPSATTSDPAMLQSTIDVAAKYGSILRTFPAKEMYFRA